MKINKIITRILLICVLGLVVFFISKQGKKPTDIVQDRQQMIHEKGMHVMPFSLDKTEHIFKKIETGGIQTILVRDIADIDNLELIRMHLKMEAENFSQGNFSDPTNLHGENMAGISVLKVNFSKMEVIYSDVEGGAKIDFKTNDNETIIAIHEWFNAQLSDHGNDASE